MLQLLQHHPKWCNFAASLRQRSLKNCHIEDDRDTLQFFYEMPSKALYSMAGLDRKVLNSRRITKIMAPSNPVFSRSFITSLWCGFL